MRTSRCPLAVAPITARILWLPFTYSWQTGVRQYALEESDSSVWWRSKMMPVGDLCCLAADRIAPWVNPSKKRPLILASCSTLFKCLQRFGEKVENIYGTDDARGRGLAKIIPYACLAAQVLKPEWIQKKALVCIGECPSIAPFLENNGPRPRKGPRSIVFKEWNDTRTFAYVKSTHRLQPLPQYMLCINLLPYMYIMN